MRDRMTMSAHRGPLVSVIIPTLDRPHLLEHAIRSVADQTFRGPIEIIVVNDGGASVCSVVERWSRVCSIKLVEQDRRAGPAVARNAGIQHSEGMYVAFLDDDDLFLPDHLVLGCEPLQRDDADFVYMGAFVAHRRLGGLPADPSEFRIKAYPYDYRVLLVANYLHTGSVIVRNFKDTSIRFDESLDVCEDWDLWIALTTSLGYRVSFMDAITSIYHQVPGGGGLVADAQTTSPSKFAIARDAINAKWPSRDPFVVTYRAWMVALERHRSELIAQGQSMPNLLFDDILQYLHERMRCGVPTDQLDISGFFE